jgi:uncharacterized phage protein (TIGR01671 family)
MREILFRGKAINRHKKGGEYRTKYKNGDWVYGLLEKHYNERFEFPAEMRNTDGVSGIQVDYKTIGQFTGLYDKNGTRIFERDIVRCKNYHGTVEGYIGYSKSGVYFLYCISGYSDECLFNCTDIEIIGNIYDNPELLKGDDKT